jgi:hypothetical protein
MNAEAKNLVISQATATYNTEGVNKNGISTRRIELGNHD